MSKNSLHKNDIKELKDKQLQLRYLLGGLNRADKYGCSSNTFWTCDINCSCTPVHDDKRLDKIRDFIEKHNISIDSFFRLLYCEIKGRFCYFNNHGYGPLIEELKDIVSEYRFITKDSILKDNNYKEYILLKYTINNLDNQESQLNLYLKKYNITLTDFLILAKTSLLGNYSQHYFWERKDIFEELNKILKENNLQGSLEEIREDRKKLLKTNNKQQK